MGYLERLYARTMREAYGHAYDLILAQAASAPCDLLECGAGEAGLLDRLGARVPPGLRYHGVERDPDAVRAAQARGIAVSEGDLDRSMPFEDARFDCVVALSVLEHLLYPCRFLDECRRVLRPGGRLVLLTPNISTAFTIALLALGRMPSSGPHPDSDALQRAERLFARADAAPPGLDHEQSPHRHLVVWSYRVLRRYLGMLGFEPVAGRGFGWYPFPAFVQPLLERLDPWHCHQMVFCAQRPR